jgi:predicted small secreted protein
MVKAVEKRSWCDGAETLDDAMDRGMARPAPNHSTIKRRSARGHVHREHAGDSGNIGSPQSRVGFDAEANLDPAAMDLMNVRFEPLSKVISMYKRMMLSSLILLAFLGVAPLLGACHTTAGAGQDISKTGQAITRAANNATPR